MIHSRRFAVAVISLLLVNAAHGEGSIGFDEVMKFAVRSQKLVKEIRNAIEEQHVKRTDIQCGAARFGNQWVNLGGDRAPPFNCQIGKRSLTINGEILFFDARGRRIRRGMDDPDVFGNAHSFRLKKPTWKWQAAK